MSESENKPGPDYNNKPEVLDLYEKVAAQFEGRSENHVLTVLGKILVDAIMSYSLPGKEAKALDAFARHAKNQLEATMKLEEKQAKRKKQAMT